MSPILGIYASQISGHLFGPSGAYDSIATVTLSGNASTITFSSIPSTYKHLQIRMIARGSATDTQENAWLRFNGDSGSNYSYHYLLGDGSNVNVAGTGSVTRILAARITASTAAANSFAPTIIDILDYSNTNKNKTVRSFTGSDLNGSGIAGLETGAWYNTSAVTSITLEETSSNPFVQYSQFALYGIKGD